MAATGERGESSFHHEDFMPPLLEFVNSNVIGGDTEIKGPFGTKKGASS